MDWIHVAQNRIELAMLNKLLNFRFCERSQISWLAGRLLGSQRWLLHRFTYLLIIQGHEYPSPLPDKSIFVAFHLTALSTPSTFTKGSALDFYSGSSQFESRPHYKISIVIRGFLQFCQATVKLLPLDMTLPARPSCYLFIIHEQIHFTNILADI
jgi:hypothetical protein